MNKIQLEELFKNFPQFKFVNVTQSNLGRKDSPTFSIYVSLDSKDTWINNIFFNSNYLIFQYYNDKLEVISKSYKLPTFRKKIINSSQILQKTLANYLSML